MSAPASAAHVRKAPRVSDKSIGATALPPYARYIVPARGALARLWVNLFLRWTAKRALHPNADVDALRAQQAGLDAKLGAPDPQVRRTPVDAGGVAVEWLEVPESRPERVLFYLHGGAFIFRFPNTHAALVAKLCRRIGARALIVDYRLAPEHKHPAAPDDCYAAYRWLLAQGVDSRNIVIAGDSAGGNLVLATLHRAKAAGEPLPRCAVMMSPFVDFTLSSASLYANERADPIFSLPGILALRELYAPPERFLDPTVSPLFGDFRGLPPMFLQVGSIEMLLDESLRLAARAQAHDVPVELEIWDRLPHVFQVFPTLPQGEEAIAHIARFIGAHAGWSA
jgi:acetyl esterase/lipase